MNLAEYYKKGDPVLGVSKILFTKLFELYNTKEINKVCNSTSGGTPNRGNAEYFNGNIPWLKSGELNDSFIEATEEYITIDGLKNSSAKLCAKGTLLVAMYGATAGKTGILNFESTTNQAICALYPKDELLRDYLYWFLRQHRIDFILQSKGGAQPNISQKVILATKIPVPPIKVQESIISFLNDVQVNSNINPNFELLDDLLISKLNHFFNIRNTNQSLNEKLFAQKLLLSQLKQAILQDAIKGKLTETWRKRYPELISGANAAENLLKQIKAEKAKLIKDGKIKKEKPLPPITKEEIPFELPKGWVWCRGFFVAEYIDPQPSHRTPPVSKDGTPYVSMKDISNDGQINLLSARKVSNKILEEHNKRYTLQNGDFIFGKIGTIGNPVWLTEPFNYTLSANLILIQSNRNILDPKYFFHFLSSPHAISHLKDTKSEMSYPVFGMNKARLMPVILPPLEEQKAIVEKVEALMQKCQALEEEIKQSETNAQMLMQAVLKEAFES